MNNESNFYMGIAEQVARASRANRLKVGAIIVKDDNIIAFGFNGTPAGFANECEENGVTKPEVLHAESNAIAKCAKSTYSADLASLYTTHSPCFECAKLIVQAGITRVYFKHLYHDMAGLRLLYHAGVALYSDWLTKEEEATVAEFMKALTTEVC